MYKDTPSDQDPALVDAFTHFISEASFPCVGAKAAIARAQLEICIAQDLRSNWDDLRIARALIDFAETYHKSPGTFRSFAVIFRDAATLDEAAFERLLWERLQSFSDKDAMFGAPYDPRVASDPATHDFSLSFGGEGFFVVGLHRAASRPARRFPHPVLVFNPHEQFEILRRQGRYEQLRGSIIDRDIALAGAPNPMLTRHGEASEARQYSGRAVGAAWQCPFERKDFSWPTETRDT